MTFCVVTQSQVNTLYIATFEVTIISISLDKRLFRCLEAETFTYQARSKIYGSFGSYNIILSFDLSSFQ